LVGAEVEEYIGVTTLTFQGHVTSSGMRPSDAPGVISYRCSIVTESVSPTVLEIFSPKNWCAQTHRQTDMQVKTVYPPVSLRSLGGYNNYRSGV